jgi:hypothetical protein
MSTAGVVTENVMPGKEYGRRSLGNCMCGGSSPYKNDGVKVLHRWLVHENQLTFATTKCHISTDTINHCSHGHILPCRYTNSSHECH